MNQVHVMKLEFALCSGIEGEWYDASVRKADVPSRALLAAGRFHHYGRRPVDVIQRRTCAHKRLLPRRAFLGGFPFRLHPPDRLGEIRLCAPEFQAAVVTLVLKQSLLKVFFRRAL